MGGGDRHALQSPFEAFPTETNPVKWSQVFLNSVEALVGSNLSKLKYFTDHFFWKVFMLSVACNYFLLGVAVSASLINEAKAQECPGALRARPYPPSGRLQRKPALGLSLADRGDPRRHPLESRRRGTLPPRFKGSSVPRPRPPLARGRGPEPRTHHRCSRGRRRPPGRVGLQADAKFKPRRGSEEAARGIASRTPRAQQWEARPRPAPPRPGCSGCGAAGPGRAARGAWVRAPGTGGCRAADDHASPLRGPHRRPALARRSPPGNPTGSLPDWPGP